MVGHLLPFSDPSTQLNNPSQFEEIAPRIFSKLAYLHPRNELLTWTHDVSDAVGTLY